VQNLGIIATSLLLLTLWAPGCSDDDSSGGSSGTGNAGTGNAGDAGGGDAGGAGGFDNGDGGSGATCLTCPEFMTAAEPTAENLCPESAPIWNAVLTCICDTACVDECGDNLCAGGAATQACDTCVNEGSVVAIGCPTELGACLEEA